MSQENDRPTPAETALGRAARAPIPAGIELRLRARLHDFRERLGTQATQANAPSFLRRHVRKLVGAGLAATLLLAALISSLGSRDAWAQVASAVHAKPWIRGTARGPDGALQGPNGEKAELWLSPGKKVAAFVVSKSGEPIVARHADLNLQEGHSYEAKDKTVFRVTLGDEDTQEITHFEWMLLALSNGGKLVKEPESRVKVLAQSHREIEEGNRKWIEFDFQFRDPRRMPPEYRTTFRVDPETRLPATMTEHYTFQDQSGAKEMDGRILVFDYPENGPADIYALGVPKTQAVVDRRRTGDTKDATQILKACCSAAQKQMEPYSATVLHTVASRRGWTDIAEAYRVRRSGPTLEVEQADPDELLALRMRLWNGDIVLPGDVDPAQWWKDEVNKLTFRGMDSADPHSVMTLLPDLFGHPLPGEPATEDPVVVDRRPASGPSDTVLVRWESHKNPSLRKSACWIVPERDHTVMRREYETDKVASEWIHTTVVDTMEKSPRGFWYVTEGRSGAIEHSGNDLPTDVGVAPVATSMYRFFVEFK
jgi:hypothetical protein